MTITNKFKMFSKNANLYLLAIVFFYISMGSFSMLQGIYVKEINIDESFLGLILSAKTLAIAVASIPCAMIVNKIGRKKGLFITMLMVPLCNIFQAIFINRWVILFLALIQGAAQGFLLVSEGPFFMDNSTPKYRIKLFSYAFAMNVFSTMFGYFIFGHISNGLGNALGFVAGLKYSIIISGLIGLISCLIILRIHEDKSTMTKVTTNFVKDMGNILRKPYPIKLFIYNLLIGFGAGLVVPYFNVYLKYKVHASTSQIGVIMSLAQGAMGIGGLITPHMAAKFGKVKTIIICQVLSIPFLMLIALPPNLMIVATAMFMRNGLMNMSGPVVNNMAMELIEPSERSIFASINGISNNLSRAFSAMVGGFIMNVLPNGYEVPYFITAITYIIATLFFYRAFRGIDDKNKSKKSYGKS